MCIEHITVAGSVHTTSLHLSMISLFVRVSNGNGAEKMLVLAIDAEMLSHKAVGALE